MVEDDPGRVGGGGNDGIEFRRCLGNMGQRDIVGSDIEDLLLGGMDESRQPFNLVE